MNLNITSSSLVLHALVIATLLQATYAQTHFARAAVETPPPALRLVKDINVTTTDSGTFNCSVLLGVPGVLNDTTFFTADNGVNGCALWKSDGTEAGTQLVKNITPGGFNGTAPEETIHSFFALSDTLYFVANDMVHGHELWRTDGTSANSQLVADIAQGSTAALAAKDDIANPMGHSFASLGNTVFFAADDGANGKELWKSNGTVTGTVMVKDIAPGGASSSPYSLVAANGKVYFFALVDQSYGLWTSDGTDGGTALVASVYPVNPFNVLLLPHSLTVVNNTVFFANQEGGYGLRLWKTDGTGAGTGPVFSTPQATIPSNIRELTALGDAVYFWASASRGSELWRSDGTAAGSQRVFENLDYGRNLLPVGIALYIFGDDNVHGNELMKIDNTMTSPVLVKDGQPGGTGGFYDGLASVSNGRLFYVGYPQTNDVLRIAVWWVSDGTMTGTITLTTQLLGNSWAVPHSNTGFAFVADAQHGTELWKSDGTVAGTHLVKDINTNTVSSTPSEFAVLNGELFFVATEPGTGREVWRSNGTPTGTVLLKDIVKTNDPLGPQALTTLDNRLYFVALTQASTPNATAAHQLWQTDGTTAGTTQLTNIPLGVGGLDCSAIGCFYNPPKLAKLGNSVFFFAPNDANNAELWKSDGILTSTQLIKTLSPAVGSAYVSPLVSAGNKLFFFTSQPNSSTSDLWMTDGTTSGTQSIPFAPVRIWDMAAVGSTIFFNAYNSGNATFSLWMTNGASNGTVPVHTVASRLPQTGLVKMGSVNGTLIAYYNDGSLWKTNGTAAGTVRIATYGVGLGYVRFWQVVNNTLFMLLPDKTGQFSLIVTDGTSTGTKLLRQNGDSTPPSYLAALGNAFIFIQEKHLWVTDGTPAGMRMAMALPLNILNYFDPARSKMLVGNTLYLTTHNAAIGYELWALTFSDQPSPSLNTLASLPVLARLPAQVPVAVTNFGSAPVTSSLSLMLTATLGVSLTYVSDSSGITPVVQGNTVMWRLPNIGVLQQKVFEVRVSCQA